MMSRLKAYLSEQDGASAAEYALILAVVGAAIAASSLFLGQQIAAAMNSAGTCISTRNPASC